MFRRPGRPVAVARSTERLPPGQRVVRGWPVLHEGEVPAFDARAWRLRVWGECEAELSLDWAEVSALPRTEVTRDWHCVTSWSRFDVRWGGVAVAEVLRRARPRETARHVLVHCFDAGGYTTNLAMEDLAREDSLLATHHDGEPLAPEHGGPIRLVVHHLYAWKSAKWVCGLELLAADRPGYWEERGYHGRGDPWLEQRYAE